MKVTAIGTHTLPDVRLGPAGRPPQASSALKLHACTSKAAAPLVALAVEDGAIHSTNTSGYLRAQGATTDALGKPVSSAAIDRVILAPIRPNRQEDAHGRHR